MALLDQHVAVVRWPDEAGVRAALRASAAPRLLIVPKGAMPPADLDVLEEWVSSTADETEVQARIAALAARVDRARRDAPLIDDDDVLRNGDRWVALGPIEARMARALAARPGEVVSRDELQQSAWGEKPVRANTTDRVMHRLRTHLGLVGLALVTVRGHGYVLEIARDLL